MKLTSKERVKLTLAHKKTDRIPCGELIIEVTFLNRLYPKMPKAFWREKMLVFCQQAGLDMITIPCDPLVSNNWIRELSWWVGNTDLFVMTLIDGLFWHPGDPLSFKKYIMSFASPDEDVNALIRQKKERAIDLVRHSLDAGAHGCIIGDDLAYDKRLFVSVKQLEQQIFPGLFEISEKIKSEKGVAFFHSCGNVTDLINSIISMGFSGFHGFSPSAGNDLFNVYSKVGNRMVIMGGIDLDDPNIKDVIKTKRRIAASPNAMRGYILASAAGLSSHTPLENVHRFYDF